MAEEVRYFLRTAIFVVGAAVVYWFVSYEPAGTVLLVVLGLALAALLALLVGHAPGTLHGVRQGDHPGGLSLANRLLGFEDAPDGAPAPLEGGPELIALASPWPILTAAAAVMIGLGLILGSWLTVPGVVLLVLGAIGWLTQLDRP